MQELVGRSNAREEAVEKSLAELAEVADRNAGALGTVSRLLADSEVAPSEPELPYLRAETDKDVEEAPQTKAAEPEETIDPDIDAVHVVRRESETAGELATNNEN